MHLDILINSILILNFSVFCLICFLHIEMKSYLNKTIFFFHIFFLIATNLIVYFFKLYSDSNNLTIISLLLTIIFLSIYLILSIISNTFIRLRVIFLPFFLILLFFFLVSNSFYNSSNSELELFNNKLLIVHILSSLLSYSMLTISSVTSLSVFVQERILKNQTYNKYFSSLLPSIYEGELLTIRFLILTLILLIVSLISGYFFYVGENSDINYFFNEKSLLSLISTIIIIFLLVLRFFYGLTTKTSFKIILLCYFFINFSYFGIKLLN